LSLTNDGININLPTDVQLIETDTTSNYSGIISVPITKPIDSVNNETTIAAFNVGSLSEAISLQGGVATILIPATGQSIGSLLDVYYSEDNGATWFLETKVFVIDNNGEPYVSFITNHFADFAVTPSADSFTASFAINNGDASTLDENVTLDISTVPPVLQMRFSNDGANRSSWEPYATTKSWTLSGAQDTKIVYTQFDLDNDSIGDISMSDTIFYHTVDKVAPLIILI
jgi:ketosteroid isomerase-like protein